MQTVITQNRISNSSNPQSEVFGNKIGLIGKLFGCWHKDLSRPFGIGRNSYIECLNCGARKHFDQNTLTTYGEFHFPPPVFCYN